MLTGRNSTALAILVAASLLTGCGLTQKSGDNLDGAELVGTRWLAEYIEGSGVMDILQSTLEFEASDRALVQGGCNRGFGNVSIAGSELRFGAFGITRRACPESVMDQEQRFLQALGATRGYRVDAASKLMYLFAEDNRELLRFSLMTGE